MERRTFLLGSSALVLGGGVLWARSSQIDMTSLAARPRLQMPPLLSAKGTAKFELTAQTGQTKFVNGYSSPTYGFNQAYLAPVLQLPQGSVSASVANGLGENISSHWHGLLLPGDHDGGPHQPVRPGQAWQPELYISQQAGTAWYHTHIHGNTARGVYAGLAGGVIVTDERDEERGLPSTYGEDDLFIIIQDKQFLSNGQLTYRTDMMSRMHGFTADTMVINGQVGAVAAVPKGVVRLRLLNGSNARIYRLKFNDDRPMHLIATDGGYLPGPVDVNELRLSPGERVEVLVDFGDGIAVSLVSKRDPNAGMAGMMGRFQRVGADILGGEFEVLTFATNGSEAKIRSIAEDLGGQAPNLADQTVSETREFSLDMGMGGGMMSGAGNGELMAINGRPFDPSRIDFEVKLGAIERWTITSSMLAHPFHIHGASFQVLSENGKSPSLENSGWKDTVLVESEIQILVKFDRPANAQAPFMYHCHILEHEDAGMMGQFAVS